MCQFLALLFTIVFMLSSSGCGTGQVLGPTLTPTLTSTATPTLTPTSTSTSTATPIPTPSVEAGLHGDNAAQTVYENGTWIVRNAKGEVTATWDEATGLWIYDIEKIKINQVLVGWCINDPTSLHKNDPTLYKDVLARPLPPDDPSTHFIDPVTNRPMGYGTFREITVRTNSMTDGEYEQSATLVSVRVRGGVEIAGYPTYLVSVPTGIDSESIMAIYVNPNMKLFVYGIANKDLVGDIGEISLNSRKTIPQESLVDFLNGQAFGRQVLLEVWTDMPVGLLKGFSEEHMNQSNKAAEDVIAFLNGSPHKPMMLYTEYGFQLPVKHIFAFPQEETGLLVIEQP